MIETIKEQLLKIKALAEQGIAGERETAARMLEGLLKKHGLRLEDLNADAKSLAWFSFETTADKKLLFQVVAMIARISGGTIEYRVRSRRCGFYLTLVEAADVSAAFSHFKKEWRHEQEKMLAAFMSREEIEDLMRRMGSFASHDWKRPAEQLAFGGSH